jgi:protease I
MKALFLSADNFEDSELLVPYYRLLEAGYTVDVASNKRDMIRGKHGYEVKVTKQFSEINPGDYGVLVLPGGKAPAAIRDDKTVQDIARSFMSEGKPLAAICHGPQILISANLVRGKRCTCYKEVMTELREAGAQYEDTEVIVDGNLITSREPKDLAAFDRELMKLLGQQ